MLAAVAALVAAVASTGRPHRPGGGLLLLWWPGQGRQPLLGPPASTPSWMPSPPHGVGRPPLPQPSWYDVPSSLTSAGAVLMVAAWPAFL